VGKAVKLIRVLKEVTEILRKKGYSFAVAGGLAYSALVKPRTTVDIDFLILLEGKKDFEQLEQELAQIFDDVLPHPKPMVFNQTEIWRVVVIKEDEEFVLDFLLAKTPFHKEALKRCIEIEFEHTILPILSLEDIFIMKSISDRPQDKLDMEEIKENYAHELDWAYIKRHLGGQR